MAWCFARISLSGVTFKAGEAVSLKTYNSNNSFELKHPSTAGLRARANQILLQAVK